MIPLSLPFTGDVYKSFVSKVLLQGEEGTSEDATIVGRQDDHLILSNKYGTFVVSLLGESDIHGDILLVHPDSQRAERIFRRGSLHNTLLVTERCDQLCVMCSQPPKKTHVDRFDYFEQACLKCEPNSLIGISGGEPTLYKEELFSLVERTIEARPDVEFHILTNGQHFTSSDLQRLKGPAFRSVIWGIPIYAADGDLHDNIVGKENAYQRLLESFAFLIRAGARVELRTVVLTTNIVQLPALSGFITDFLQFIECWSIMQLENIGFAKNRWASLYWDHCSDFRHISHSIDIVQQHGIDVRLFNFPSCTVPLNYRHLAPPSISDWKRKYDEACEFCSAKDGCSGFFEWHPRKDMNGITPL